MPTTNETPRRPSPALVWRRPRSPSGFTLVENLIAATVLAAAVIAISTALNFSYANAVQVDTDETAVALARQLMEQLAALPYYDPTATRDSVVEYDGYTDTFNPSGTTRGGTAINVGSGWSYARQVRVKYRQVPALAVVNAGQTQLSNTGSMTDMALVTVFVTTPKGARVEVSRLFARTTTE